MSKLGIDEEENDRLAKESDVTVGGSVVPPSTEYFGFALYVGSSVVLLAYLIWAFFPAAWLHSINIYYYPSRWWAVAIPSFLIMSLVYIYTALACYNTEMLTSPLDSLSNITDDYAKVIERDQVVKYLNCPSDGVWDMPMSTVCEVLYTSDST